MPLPPARRPHMSDPDLIRKCIEGDQQAWEGLIDQYGRLVYSIPARYGMSEDDANDVFQDVFMILLKKLDQIRDQNRISSWLITTTHRECWRRGRRQPVQLDIDEHDVVADAPPEEVVTQWENQRLVRDGLEGLGNPCKSLLEMLFLSSGEGDYESVAERLGIPVGSIGPTRARCFRKLERILRDLGYQDEAGGSENEE